MVLKRNPARILVRLVLNWKVSGIISRFCATLFAIGCTTRPARQMANGTQQHNSIKAYSTHIHEVVLYTHSTSCGVYTSSIHVVECVQVLECIQVVYPSCGVYTSCIHTSMKLHCTHIHQVVLYTHPWSCIVHTSIRLCYTSIHQVVLHTHPWNLYCTHIHQVYCTHIHQDVVYTHPSICIVHTFIKLYPAHIHQIVLYTHPSSCIPHTSMTFVLYKHSSNCIVHTSIKLCYTHIYRVVFYTHSSNCMFPRLSCWSSGIVPDNCLAIYV